MIDISDLRECNACDWIGNLADCVWCGAVGPLCPVCHETTEQIEDSAAYNVEEL